MLLLPYRSALKMQSTVQHLFGYQFEFVAVVHYRERAVLKYFLQSFSRLWHFHVYLCSLPALNRTQPQVIERNPDRHLNFHKVLICHVDQFCRTIDVEVYAYTTIRF